MHFPLKKLMPNFETLTEVLRGEREPEKTHTVEILVDFEVIAFLANEIMGKKQPFWDDIKKRKIEHFIAEEEITLLTEKEERIFLKNYIDFYYRMGYDYVPDLFPILYLSSMILPKVRLGNDTATLSRSKGKREWVEEGRGVITCWEDFENFPWERMRLDVEQHYRFLSENLPEGMKITVTGSLFEQVLERLLGYEGLFYLLYDQPALVKEVFDRWGRIIYEYYQSVISLGCVGAIFHADDLGYKTGTIVSPKVLRQFVFPWFKKYASLAHEYGKMYWYHCCGNVLKIMKDLIDDVKIDAFHSFQDVIIPVTTFKKRYGRRVAALGGVDMDKLCRMDEENLRKYVRDIIQECVPCGRFALGSGNSIANYVPVRNYLVILDEAINWGIK